MAGPRKRSREDDTHDASDTTKRAKISEDKAPSSNFPVAATLQGPQNGICARCTELGVFNILNASNGASEIRNSSRIVAQRLIFDTSEPLRPECKACTGMDDAIGSWIVLKPSRLYRRGTSEVEAKQLLSKSTFIYRGKAYPYPEIYRCTDYFDHDRFSIDQFDRMGWGHWVRELFERFAATSGRGTVRGVRHDRTTRPSPHG
jgi:hypothetical protein